MNDTEEERESDGALLARMGTDAAVWADELVSHARAVAEREGTDSIDQLRDSEPGGFLHTWLCSAIEAGRSAGYSAAQKEHNPNWPLPAERAS